MKTYQRALVGLIVIVGIVAAILFGVKKIEAPSIESFNPREISVAVKTSVYEITGSYPQFPQASASFNKEIANAVTTDISDFTHAANERYAAYVQNNGTSFTQSFHPGDYYFNLTETIVQSNANFVSVILREESFADGAHPSHIIETFNYDVKKHHDLAITDFISLTSLSQSAQEELGSVLAKAADEVILDANLQQMLSEGIDPAVPDNFSKFTFDGKNLQIYFSEYQVAPYVFGEQEVSISLKKTP